MNNPIISSAYLYATLALGSNANAQLQSTGQRGLLQLGDDKILSLMQVNDNDQTMQTVFSVPLPQVGIVDQGQALDITLGDMRYRVTLMERLSATKLTFLYGYYMYFKRKHAYEEVDKWATLLRAEGVAVAPGELGGKGSQWMVTAFPAAIVAIFAGLFIIGVIIKIFAH